MIWNRQLPRRGDQRSVVAMLWWPCVLTALLSSCRPADPSHSAVHASDCGRASEAQLPISDERLRAEIEQRAGLAPGGYIVRSRCRLDTGQFIVTVDLTVESGAAGPIQTRTFLIQPDGRVEQVTTGVPPTT